MSSASVDVLCVAPDLVSQFWPLVSHYIRFAMEKGRLNEFADIERNILDHKALLWIIWDGKDILGAGATELSVVHDEKFCTIVACSGRQKQQWVHLIDKIEKYAKAENCNTMQIYGRRGWAREFPSYKMTRVLLEKAI